MSLIKLKNHKLRSRKSLNNVFIAIGTNKGNREKNIRDALKLLKENKNIKILKVSSMLNNPPQEGIKSGYFLNGVIKLKTSLTPLQVLRTCKDIERILGRTMGQKKKPRIIDLDILFYENKILRTPKFTIPHPMLHKRYFVLIPLVEIAPGFHHPIFKKSIRELYDDLKVSKCLCA